jgi:hypothetical protein
LKIPKYTMAATGKDKFLTVRAKKLIVELGLALDGQRHANFNAAYDRVTKTLALGKSLGKPSTAVWVFHSPSGASPNGRVPWIQNLYLGTQGSQGLGAITAWDGTSTARVVLAFTKSGSRIAASPAPAGSQRRMRRGD